MDRTSGIWWFGLAVALGLIAACCALGIMVLVLG